MNSDSRQALDPQLVDAARRSNDIAEVIGEVVPLHTVKTNLVGNCPFHDEATANFNVNPERQIFHCFGCHSGGDVIRFVQDFHRVTFREAVERLSVRASKRKAHQ